MCRISDSVAALAQPCLYFRHDKCGGSANDIRGDMSRILRRMLMVSAGVAALTAAPSGAEAAGLIDSQEMEQRCLGVGGQVARDDSDGQYRCATPALDDRCNYPARYDNAGNRLT